MVRGILSILISLYVLCFGSVIYAVEPESSLAYKALAQSTVDIKIKIRPRSVQLGQPVTLVIEGEHLAESISKIDWNLFRKDFVIDDIDQGSSLLRARLYPLHTGKHEIKAQRAGAINLPNMTIEVEENPNVEVAWQSPSIGLYSQQQAVWKAKVKVSNPAYLVELTAREGRVNKDVTVHVLQEASIENTNTGDASSLERVVGTSHSLISSYEIPSVFNVEEMILDSPVVEVKNTSNQRWKFFDFPKEVQVKPVPSFLPMSVAVGELDWRIDTLSGLYKTGSLHYWQWTLIGKGVTSEYLKGTAYQLLSQLQHSDNISWLSESIEVEDSADSQGMLTSLKIQVPYRINQAGLVTMPELVLRSFNPETGMISQQMYPSTTAWVLPAWLMWIVQWLILLLVLMGLFMSLYLIKQFWFKYKLTRAIRFANSANEIWLALQAWQNDVLQNGKTQVIEKDSVEIQLSFMSIGLWQDWYLNEFNISKPQADQTAALVEALNSELFSKPKLQNEAGEAGTESSQLAKQWIKGQSSWPTNSQLKRYFVRIRYQQKA